MITNKFWVVWREQTPSLYRSSHDSLPTKKHESVDAARQEALRLATKFPQENFYVLESEMLFNGNVTVDITVLR